MGRFRAKPRANGYEIDVKAPDGFTLGGWRLVRKGGYVTFVGSKWSHPDMAALIGKYVFVHVDCCLGTEASYTDDYNKRWSPPWNGEQFNGGRKPMTVLP